MAKQGFKSRPSNGTALEGVNGVTVSNSQVIEIDSSSGQLGAGGLVSYTPVLSFGGGTTGILYSTQSGNYYRMGKVIWFHIGITLTSKGSSTGTAQITLPFTSNAGGPCAAGVGFDYITFGASTFVTSQIANATNYITLQQENSGGARAALTDANFANNTNMSITGFYTIT